MNIFLVYCHMEPSSLTASMKNLAAQELAAQGHNVVISDLYAQGFSAVAQKWDFVTTTGKHFNYAAEQKHAADLGMSFAPDIMGEIEKLKAADMVVFFTPLWWFSVPALLKGWFDRVLAKGVAWEEDKIYEAGVFRGKQAALIVSVGHPASYFGENSIHNFTLRQALHPINHTTLAFCGFDVHEPFIAIDADKLDQAGIEKTLGELQYRLKNLIESPNWLVKY